MQKQNSEGFTEMRRRYRNADGVEVGGDWGGAVVKVRRFGGFSPPAPI